MATTNVFMASIKKKSTNVWLLVDILSHWTEAHNSKTRQLLPSRVPVLLWKAASQLGKQHHYTLSHIALLGSHFTNLQCYLLLLLVSKNSNTMAVLHLGNLCSSFAFQIIVFCTLKKRTLLLRYSNCVLGTSTHLFWGM